MRTFFVINLLIILEVFNLNNSQRCVRQVRAIMKVEDWSGARLILHSSLFNENWFKLPDRIIFYEPNELKINYKNHKMNSAIQFVSFRSLECRFLIYLLLILMFFELPLSFFSQESGAQHLRMSFVLQFFSFYCLLLLFISNIVYLTS